MCEHVCARVHVNLVHVMRARVHVYVPTWPSREKCDTVRGLSHALKVLL